MWYNYINNMRLKGRGVMKRIICAITAVALAVCVAIPAFAASSKVTVKNNTSTKPVTYTYDSDDTYETVKSIKTLVSSKLNEVTKSKMRTQTLTITSDSANAEPVSFKLRISVPETTKNPTANDYAAIDYYKLKVNSENGTPLYTYDGEPDNTEEKSRYKDIPLGVLNTSKASESATYNITLSINGDISSTAVAAAAKKLDWSIVSEPYAEPEETPSPEPSEEGAEEIAETELTETAAPSAAPDATPASSPVPTAKVKSDKNGNYKLSQGEYTIGTDIDADRYTLTGSGLVNIYNSDGALERTVALKTKDDKSSNGVTEYVLDLSKGEKISVDNEAVLEPYVAPTASPTPSATPKAAASSGSSSSSSAGSSKSNPKTGDNMPVAAMSAVGVFALLGAVLITLKKKNK